MIINLIKKYVLAQEESIVPIEYYETYIAGIALPAMLFLANPNLSRSKN